MADKSENAFFSSVKKFGEEVSAVVDVEDSSKPPRQRRSRADQASTAKADESTSTGGTSPTDTSDQQGGGGGGDSGGGSSPWSDSNRARIIRILVVAFIAIIISQLFWEYRSSKNKEHENTTAGLVDKEVERLKAEKKLVEAKAELAAASAPVARQEQTAPVLPAQQGYEQYVSDNKRAMIGRCGKNVQELTYKPAPGCFYFDNLSGSSEKTVRLWFRGTIHSIVGEFDDKPNIVMTASDGGSCESGPADHCELWTQQRRPDADGFRKITIRVPQGQGFIATMRTY